MAYRCVNDSKKECNGCMNCYTEDTEKKIPDDAKCEDCTHFEHLYCMKEMVDIEPEHKACKFFEEWWNEWVKQ